MWVYRASGTHRSWTLELLWSVLGGHSPLASLSLELWGAWKGKIMDHIIPGWNRPQGSSSPSFRVSPFLTAVKPGVFVSLLWYCVTASIYSSEAKHLPWFFFLTYFLKFFWLLKGQEGDARRGLGLWEIGYMRESDYPKLCFLAPGAWLQTSLELQVWFCVWLSKICKHAVLIPPPGQRGKSITEVNEHLTDAMGLKAGLNWHLGDWCLWRMILESFL